MFILSSSRLRKKIAWLALCAMLMSALAPTVSRWLTATARAAEQIAVCGEHGVTLVDAPPGWQESDGQQQAQNSRQDNGTPSHHQSAAEDDDCCPYCTLARHSPYVPVAQLAFAPDAPLPAAQQQAADIPAPALPARHAPHSPQAPPARA